MARYLLSPPEPRATADGRWEQFVIKQEPLQAWMERGRPEIIVYETSFDACRRQAQAIKQIMERVDAPPQTCSGIGLLMAEERLMNKGTT